MGKFGIGARVRLIEEHSSGGPEVGALGTVFAKGFSKGKRDVIWDEAFDGHDGEANDGSTNHWYVPKSKLEVVTVDEPTTTETWVPKVGDRVRRVKTSGNSTTPVGFVGVIRSIENDGDDIFRFDDGAWGYNDVGAEWVLEPIQPVVAEAQSAGLQIEAGKFYRTRDGRKAGPLRDQGTGDGYPFDERDSMDFWSPTGKSQFDDNDLIAEWIDEPVVAAETPTERKFKVGDVVNYVYDGREQGAWQGITILEDDGTLYFAEQNGTRGAFYEDWLELAEPVAVAPATATVKVGDRVWDGSATDGEDQYNHATVSAVRADGRFTVNWDDGDIGEHWWTLASWGNHKPATLTDTTPAANDNHEVTLTVDSAEKVNLLRAYADLLNAA